MRLRLTRRSSVSLVANYWWWTILAAAVIAIAGFLLTYKLATLTPGMSAPELVQRHESAHIVQDRNPLFFVQNGLQYVAQKLKHYGPVAMRLPSVIIASVTVFCLYNVLTRWYTKRIALIGITMLATSAWFLHVARLGTVDVTFFLLFCLFAAGVWLHRAPAKRLAIITCFILTATLLYVPGMIWFLLPLTFWQRRLIKVAFGTLNRWQQVVLILLAAIVLIPLVVAGLYSHNLILTWLGLPQEWLPAKEIGKNILRIPMYLFWRGPDDPTRWLDRLPLLDWFQIVMFAIGVYAYRFMLNLDKTKFILYVFIVGSLLIALNGPVQLSLLLPFVFVIIIGGAALMLQQWFTVFPRNPFARGVGLVVLMFALVTSCLYQVNHYFVAWPRNPETKAAFQHQP